MGGGGCWNSSVFLPKGVSTEILYVESGLVWRTREDEAGMGVSLAATGSDNSPGRGRVFVIKQQHFVLNVLTIVCITELHVLVYPPPPPFTVTVNLVSKSEVNYSSSVNSEVNTEDLEVDTTHTAWHCEGSCSLVLNPGGGG